MGAPPSSRFWWPERPGPERTIAELLASRVGLRGDATALIEGRTATLAPLRNRRRTEDGELLVSRDASPVPRV